MFFIEKCLYIIINIIYYIPDNVQDYVLFVNYKCVFNKIKKGVLAEFTVKNCTTPNFENPSTNPSEKSLLL